MTRCRHHSAPGYHELVQAYRTGEFDALICWDPDRLTRQPQQFEDWIGAAEELSFPMPGRESGRAWRWEGARFVQDGRTAHVARAVLRLPRSAGRDALTRHGVDGDSVAPDDEQLIDLIRRTSNSSGQEMTGGRARRSGAGARRLLAAGSPEHTHHGIGQPGPTVRWDRAAVFGVNALSR